MRRFREWLKWAKQFRKNHTKDELRQIYTQFYITDYRRNLYTCECGNAVVSNDSVSRIRVGMVSNALDCPSCHYCKDCCNCVNCSRCSVFNTSVCDNCSQGVSNCGCCSCSVCDVCEVVCGSDRYCRTCNNCLECCKCALRVKFHSQAPIFHSATRLQHKSNKSSRFIAAEIEVAKISETPVAREVSDLVIRWGGSVVRDGSLPELGFEINTSPASGDLYIDQVYEICAKLKEAGAEVNNKCGLHIHIDARDLNYYDIRRLIKIYAFIENVLFSMVPDNRRKSKYCLPCGVEYSSLVEAGKLPYAKVKADVIGGIYKKDRPERTEKYSQARYSALNIHSWFYRGTIECRMFEGTIDPQHITLWGMMLANVVDYAVKTTDESVSKVVGGIFSPLDYLFAMNDNANIKAFIKEMLERNNTFESSKMYVEIGRG